jgi:multidrug efflux system outer membrane protein
MAEVKVDPADDEAVRAAYDLTKVTVAAETARAYADLCNAGEELEVTRRSLQLQVQSTETTRRLVEAGRTSSLDLTRSSGQVAQVRANIPALEAQRMNALYRLAALTGKPPAEYPRSVESCATAPHLQQPLPIGDATALLRRRPDVREAERELAAATARIGVATADLYPRVTVVVFYTIVATTSRANSGSSRIGGGLPPFRGYLAIVRKVQHHPDFKCRSER